MQDVMNGLNRADPALVEAVGSGDSGALGELMVRHDRWVRGIVYAVVKDIDRVDDVTQEIWLTVWQRAALIDDRTKWRNWLYRLAKNVAIDTIRRRRNWRRCLERFRSLCAARSSRPREPETHVSVAERHQVVLGKIEELPKIYREVFVLRHVEDWNYREIAEVLGLPVATVETRLVRARRMLRGTLRECIGID